jgi:histidinol-phosphate aminotransferase/imidazoleglycerol-phosphate dehydratase/histidinol-phosphatase
MSAQTSLAEKLARPEIRALAPFDMAETGPDPDAILLDSNESPFAPMGTDVPVNRYPESQPVALRARMAALYGVDSEHLWVSRGADDAIELLIRTFCKPGEDAIAISSPTFTAYERFAAVQGARVIDVPLDGEFDWRGEALVEAVEADGKVKLVFVCSPANPTGNVVAPADILALAERLPDTIIVADEAYIEFADVESLAHEAARRENLVVLRTLSKAFGLAGARVGALLGHPDTVAMTSRASPFYPLPVPSIEAAMAALAPSRRSLHERRIAELLAERARLAEALDGADGVKSVRVGGGNFLFLEAGDPEGLAREMRARAIRIRFRPQAAPGGVRLTVGTREENDAALAAFGVSSARSPSRRAEVVRETKETRVALALDLDAEGPRRVATGNPFFDHMLDQVAAHGGFALNLTCQGDLEVDAHHTIEDCSIALGEALREALGDKRGIGRYGFALPMDEAQAKVLIDLSGRPYAVWEGEFDASHIGDYPTEMTSHVFRSLSDSMKAAIHVEVAGDNDHHKTEGAFKAFGRALRQAIRAEGDVLPSTKGML